MSMIKLRVLALQSERRRILLGELRAGVKNMKVKFFDVGSTNASWTAEIKSLDYEVLYRQVKSKGAIMSSGIEFTYDEESKEGDIIVGMFRKVGEFKVIE